MLSTIYFSMQFIFQKMLKSKHAKINQITGSQSKSYNMKTIFIRFLHKNAIVGTRQNFHIQQILTFSRQMKQRQRRDVKQWYFFPFYLETRVRVFIQTVMKSLTQVSIFGDNLNEKSNPILSKLSPAEAENHIKYFYGELRESSVSLVICIYMYDAWLCYDLFILREWIYLVDFL